jgi:hypothetical protein
MYQARATPGNIHPACPPSQEERTMKLTYPGGCLCGAVRYLVTGSPINERICHCRLCQKALGASFNARMLFKAEEVAVEGPLAMFTRRPTCGAASARNAAARCFQTACQPTPSA